MCYMLCFKPGESRSGGESRNGPRLYVASSPSYQESRQISNFRNTLATKHDLKVTVI